MDKIITPSVVQSPPANTIQHTAQVSLTSRSPASVVHLVQYDTTTPIIAVALTANGQPYTVPDGAAVNIRLAKPDGTYVYNPAYGLSADSQTVYIAVTVQMTVCIGKLSPVVEVVIDGGTAATGFFVLDIDPNPIPEDAIASTDEYQTIQQLAAEVEQAAQIITENEAAIQAIGENLTAIQNAPTAAANAAASATLAESWAVGGTGTRPGENTNNAEYWAQQAQAVAQGQLGWYATPQELQSAHPSGQNGQWAIIGTTDTIWTWDSDTSAWVNSGAQVDLSNYYTKAQADSEFAPYNHRSPTPVYGMANETYFGHVKLSDTPSASDVSSGIAATPSCVQGAAFYNPGDTLSFSQEVIAHGLVTSSAKDAIFMLCLSKPVSASVSSISVTGGSIVARGVRGYIIGGSGDYVSISSLSPQVTVENSFVHFDFNSNSAYDTVNNTVAVASFAGLKLQFN